MNSNNKISGSSPQVYAKLGGILYLLIIIAGLSTEFLFRGKLISSDVKVTANNLEASETLWRVGIAVEYLSLICTITLSMIYYFLLRPVNKNLNLLATFFRVISIIIQIVAVLALTQALFPLLSSDAGNAFTPAQLYTMVNLSIKAHSFGYGISLLFLGCCFLIHGYLIFRSGFLPKALGVMIQIAGAGYLFNSFTLVLDPGLTTWTFPIIVLPVLVAETSLSLWLLIKGVNVNKWQLKNAATV